MAMRPPVPVPTLSRRAKLVLGAIAVLLVLFTVIGSLTNVYVDYLWFAETDYTEVFWTELQSRALLFAVAGVATGGLTALAIYLAYRFRPTFRPMSLEQQNLERYRQSLEPRAGLVLTAVAVVLGLFAGFAAQGSWETWLTFRNSTDFGQTDPQFGLDLSFFVFEYPFYRLVLGFGFAIVILALIGSLVTHYVFGGLRLQTPGQKLTSAARVQISVLLGVFVALKAVAYWLDRYGLVYSDRGDVFTGASYTDINALLVPKTILVFVAAVCAIAFFANIVFRNFLLPAAALVLLLASSLVIGVAYPAIVQQFVVKPSANEREAPYIERAIEMTRQAYGLDDVEYVDYAQETEATADEGEVVDPEVALAELRNDTETIPNARLLDPNVLTETFTARQQIRNWYGFPEKLDVDRYTVDGKTRGLRRGGARAGQHRACRRTRAPGSTGTPSTPTGTASSPRRRTRWWPGPRAASRTSPPATCPSAVTSRRAEPDLLRRADRRLLRGRRARRCRRRASPTCPRAAPTTARSTTPTTARAGCRSAASSGS